MRRFLVALFAAITITVLLTGCANDSPGDPAVDDVDGDGVPTIQDNCPFDANFDQSNCDNDVLGNACDSGDADGDFKPDHADNCPCTANASQVDSDGDGLGDACDGGGGGTDTDADTIPNATDNCPTVANASQTNSDADGLGDACDNCDTVANSTQADLPRHPRGRQSFQKGSSIHGLSHSLLRKPHLHANQLIPILHPGLVVGSVRIELPADVGDLVLPRGDEAHGFRNQA